MININITVWPICLAIASCSFITEAKILSPCESARPLGNVEITNTFADHYMILFVGRIYNDTTKEHFSSTGRYKFRGKEVPIMSKWKAVGRELCVGVNIPKKMQCRKVFKKSNGEIFIINENKETFLLGNGTQCTRVLLFNDVSHIKE